MEMREFTTYRLVKSEDLNHHGTLFAGRGAEWFVESGFIAAASVLDPKHLICVKIHGMSFKKPARAGETLCYASKLVYAGRTSLTAFVKVNKGEETVVGGFITFVHVDDQTRPNPHQLTLEAGSEEEKKLQQEASMLQK
jgi:acyl-CoA hydrolase